MERVAANYSPPGSLLAFEDGPMADSRLTKPGYESVHAMQDSASLVTRRPVGYFPGWLAGDPWPPFVVLLFSHQLTDADGVHKLVAVTLSLTDFSDQAGTALVRASVAGHSFMSSWSSGSTPPALTDLIRFHLHPGHGVLRVYAGQPDSSDPSHATIDYVSGKHHRTIDIWLKPKGRILSSVREVIATTVPSASHGTASGQVIETQTTADSASRESLKNDPRLRATQWYKDWFSTKTSSRPAPTSQSSRSHQ